MAQFRNLLVHDYARIDEIILFGILRKNVDDLVDYVVAIMSKLPRAAV
ncbi:MAG: HepT-like ribonuclease domain-containing protein [Bacillota bacterium]